ncbi:MAG: hypothetical protein IOD12_11845 [Silvanigrellales bacterium]|jgi:hypothetical protein|nr:hypothetical protein [Silvanigrellales bacterium]
MGRNTRKNRILKASRLLVVMVLVVGCRKEIDRRSSSREGAFTQPPGERAGSLDATALNGVHAVTTTKAPAAIRPDPDLYARRLLRQYREEGPLVAREIGRVEEYRMLLGGASEDFRVVPQESYDSTSLLAMQKVAEEICLSLVAPTPWQHPGWNSILPQGPSALKANVTFLAQRFLGVPTSRIPADVITDLVALTQSTSTETGLTNEAYVPACVALSTDAEALLL